MTIRRLAGILLFSGDSLLMMKRGSDRELSPGLWANIGGHVEKGESAFPAAAALRELKEETGISAEEVRGLFMRYIVLQKTGDELRVFYDFTATCDEKLPLASNGEGDLFWIPIKDVMTLEMPVSLRLLLEHYFSTPYEKKTIVGIMGNKDTEPPITWHALD